MINRDDGLGQSVSESWSRALGMAGRAFGWREGGSWALRRVVRVVRRLSDSHYAVVRSAGMICGFVARTDQTDMYIQH